MISPEVFVGSITGIIGLLGGAGSILFRYIIRQAETIATLHKEAIADKDRQITNAFSDRDFYRERLFDITRTAEISASNTRRAMDRSGEYPGRS